MRLLTLSVIFFLSIHSTSAQTDRKSTKIHIRPENTRAGDVIPYYHDSDYHVFYLRDNNWAHVVSKDLVNWTELPDALSKSVDSLGPDGEACWTGSIVESNGIFYLFYTGKNSRDPKGDQKVMMATSKDLIHWIKEPQHTFYADGNIYWNKTMNGAIDDRLIYHHQAFRDPEVSWNKEKKEWWMILHATLADGSSPAMGLYVSKDLINWRPSKPLLVYPHTLSGDCPFLFSSKKKWFLNFADHHYKSADSLEGLYDAEVGTFDCGNLFVPKVMWDGNRFVLIGWISDYEGNVDSGKTTWGGTLCMPREIYTDAAGNEFQRPLKEIISSFQLLGAGKADKFVRKSDLKLPEDFMFHAQLEAKTTETKATICFSQLKHSAPGGYHLKIDFQSKEIEIGSKYKTYKRVCDFDSLKPVDVRIFLMGNVLECFINNAWAFTMRAYDKPGNYMSIVAQNGLIGISSYEVFKPLSPAP
jgi:sucrose-6-phosphate hydrolase SacC (GH32 family)